MIENLPKNTMFHSRYIMVCKTECEDVVQRLELFDIGAIIPKFLTFLIVKKKLSIVSFSKVTSGFTINA